MAVDHTYRSPPPGIRYAAERGPRLIHLHRVHESREGEDAHGDEKKQAAHLNQDRGVCRQQAPFDIRHWYINKSKNSLEVI